MPKGNRLAEAFKESFNVVGLAGAAALSAALLNPIPLLVGLVAEAAYLLFVPDSKWYDVRLSRRFDAEVERRRLELRNQTFPHLRPEMQERFLRLEAMRRQIDAQAKSDEQWFREVLRKLDYLLEKFLLFASKEAQFRAYLRSVWDDVRVVGGYDLSEEGVRSIPVRDKRARGNRPASSIPPPSSDELPRGGIERMVTDIQERHNDDVASVRALIENETDANTRAVLEKRADVLEQRHEHVGRLGKILTNLTYQLQLLEDTFGLINDQIRARSPEQVLSDIEEVVYQTDSMTKLLDELAPYEQMTQKLSAG